MIHNLTNRLKGDSLKSRFLRSSVWLAIGNVAEKALALASKIILAHLLLQEELGVIVLIISITGLFECISEVGVKQCIIQNPNSQSYEFLNMAWWFQAIRGTGLFAIAWFATPSICHFYFADQEQVLARYDWPTLIMMVRIAFTSMLFNGFISPKAHLLEKQFNFSKVVAYMQSSAIIGTILTIVLSFILRNAWAMVLGFACQIFLRMLISYVFCPFMPSLKFHKESMSQIIHFAKGMWGSPLFAYIAYNIDVLVGGKLLPSELIGMYGFAVSIAYIPRDLFTRIINPVLMPAFAEKQDQQSKLKEVIEKLIRGLILVATPCIAICFIFHKYIITLIYGNDFEAVTVVFALFTVNVTCLMISMVFVNLTLGIGKPHLSRNIVFIRAALLATLIYPSAKYLGINGMALSQIFVNLIILVLFYKQTKKVVPIQWTNFIPRITRNKK